MNRKTEKLIAFSKLIEQINQLSNLEKLIIKDIITKIQIVLIDTNQQIVKELEAIERNIKIEDK